MVIVTAVALGDDNEIGIEKFAFGGVAESAVALDVLVLLGGTEAIRHFVVGFGEFGLDTESGAGYSDAEHGEEDCLTGFECDSHLIVLIGWVD